jgi:hypothetical protein
MKRIVIVAALALSGCAIYPVALTDETPQAARRPSMLVMALEALLLGPDTSTTTYWVNGTPTRVSVYQSPNGRRSSVTVH